MQGPGAVLILFYKIALKVNKNLTKLGKYLRRVCVFGGGEGTQYINKSTP